MPIMHTANLPNKLDDHCSIVVETHCVGRLSEATAARIHNGKPYWAWLSKEPNLIKLITDGDSNALAVFSGKSEEELQTGYWSI